MAKLLIFGYSGFVGPYLAKEFLKDKYVIIGSDIIDPINYDKDVKFYKLDLLKFNEVNSLINLVKPDMIINLAAISSVGLSWKMPQKTMEINVIGALNILEAARQLENKPKVMFVGSSEEYAPSDKPLNENSPIDANNPYGISKITQEKYAELYRKQYGMKVYCVRAFNHTGIGQKDTFVLPSFCKQVAEIEKSGKPGIIKVGNLEAIRDFSDVRDIVRAYKLIIESDDCETIYNVGSGKAYSLKELLDYIISLSSQKIEVVVDKERYRPIDTPYICCDIKHINNTLFVKNKSIFSVLKEMFKYFVEK
jgi:GDP-4-dehydro-6-deoxy-D-mannose reductase